ncbi:MAG: hypothetical protein MJ002_03685 [Paludibacteraceae bacterium]|nr:hypothetical protein [Paludibacteraceae bacterium]
MNKQHSTPEFELIMQDRANAKFFVASGGDFTQNPSSSTEAVTTYEHDSGDEINM